MLSDDQPTVVYSTDRITRHVTARPPALSTIAMPLSESKAVIGLAVPSDQVALDATRAIFREYADSLAFSPLTRNWPVCPGSTPRHKDICCLQR